MYARVLPSGDVEVIEIIYEVEAKGRNSMASYSPLLASDIIGEWKGEYPGAEISLKMTRAVTRYLPDGVCVKERSRFISLDSLRKISRKARHGYSS